MDQPQPTKENLSYKHDRLGFMLYYRSQPIGGMGQIRDRYIIDDQDPRAKEYEEIAKRHIEMILSGDHGNYRKTIKRVDTVFNPPRGERGLWAKRD